MVRTEQQKIKHKEYMRAYRQKNPEQRRACDRAYRLAHKEQSKLYKKEHAEQMKAYSRIYGKAYRLAHPKKELTGQVRAKTEIYNKAYRLANKDKRKKYDQDNPERITVARRKYRSLKRGNAHEPYRDIDIFERDEWICGICGQKINKRLKTPNPRSKSIDHIIPLSKGGANAPINVQAVHLRCNLRKNAGGGGQLRLMS